MQFLWVPPMDGLNPILADLRQGGRLDSADVFRLNPAMALRKLKQSLLEDPHHAILKAVQTAVSLECPELKVGTGLDLTLSFGKGLVLPRSIDDPYQLLLPREGARNHLATMLVGLLALANGKLEFPFSDPDGAKLLTVEQDRVDLGPGQKPGPLRVQLPAEAQRRMLELLPMAWMAPLAGLPGTTPNLPPCAALAEVEADPSWGSLRLPARPRRTLCLRQGAEAAGTPCQALVAFVPSLQQGRILVLQDGIVVDRVDALPSGPVLGNGQLAYLSGSDLPCDLEGFRLSQSAEVDQILEERRQVVARALWELRDQMAEQFDRLHRPWDVARAFLTTKYGRAHCPVRE